MLFQIKIALVGKVSVGKSTVLNATLRGNRSKMHWDRQTAAEHRFLLTLQKSSPNKRKARDRSSICAAPKRCTRRASTFTPSFDLDSTNQKEATDVHQENDSIAEAMKDDIAEEQIEIKESDPKDADDASVDPPASDEKQKTVPIEEQSVILHEENVFGGVSMREDTEIVLIDLPGLDDPDCEDDYHAHVERSLSDFDGIIVVLDADRPQTARNFLRYIKQNWVDCMKKDVPLFILANKVDNPSSEGAKEKLDGICKSVENVFGINDCTCALEQALSGNNEPQYPLVLPISAERAFLYHSARVMSVEEFKEIPMEMVERVASAEIGAFRWKEASRNEKFELAHNAIKEQKLFEKRLSSTNFDKFMKLFAMTFCQDEVKAKLIDRQIDYELKSLDPSTNMVDQIMTVYDKKKLLGQDTASLSQCFWEHYAQLAGSILDDLEGKGPTHVSELGKLVDLLISFHKRKRPSG